MNWLRRILMSFIDSLKSLIQSIRKLPLLLKGDKIIQVVEENTVSIEDRYIEHLEIEVERLREEVDEFKTLWAGKRKEDIEKQKENRLQLLNTNPIVRRSSLQHRAFLEEHFRKEADQKRGS